MHAKRSPEFQALIERLLLQRYAPTAVLVNSAGDVLHVSGKIDRYCELVTDEASGNLLTLVRADLQGDLLEAFQATLVRQTTVTVTAIHTDNDGIRHHVEISLTPCNEPADLRGLLLVVFADVSAPSAPLVSDHTVAHLTDLFESAPVAYFILDRTGHIVQANSAGLGLVGRNHHLTIGARLDRFVCDADHSMFSECLERAYAGQASQNCVVAWCGQAAGPRQVHISVRASADTRTSRVVVSDTTDVRDLAAAALKQSEENLQLALTASNLGTWHWAIESNQLEWSQTCLAMFGIPVGTVMNYERFLAALHPDDRMPIDQAVRAALDQRSDYVTEFRVLWPDGSLRWIAARGRGFYNRHGVAVRMVGVTLDITARKTADLALRESEERYRQIVQTANEGIWIIDDQANTTFVNPKMAEMLGWTAAEMQGQPLTNYMDEEGKQIAAANLKRRQQGIVEQHDFKFMRKDGSALWTLIATNPFFSSTGAYAGAMAMVTDITERRRLEDDLRHAQKMEAVGRLAGGIAHDFNNQLTVIQGYGTLALKNSVNEEMTASLTHILHAAERSAELVKQLLSFSRKSRKTVAVVDVHGLIIETLEILSRSVSKLIRLRQSLTTEAALVNGDANLLQNALLNLAINARDALPDGGEILFTTMVVVLDQTHTARMGSDMRPGPHLAITISDNGHGMSEDVQRHLFEPFFSTKGPGKGTGLGLASVYGTVQQHGGGIEVDSAIGRGTAIRVFLPLLVDSQQNAIDNTGTPASIHACTATILVVEDESLVAALVSETLTIAGHGVTCKADGAAGLEYYRVNWQTIDLIILDMNMPIMDGTAVFAAVRAINPDARVLIMSGYSETGSIEVLLQHGAIGFIAKPFTPNYLLQRVAQIAPLRTSHAHPNC